VDRWIVGLCLIVVWPAIVGVMSYGHGIKSATCPDGWQRAYRVGTELYCSDGSYIYSKKLTFTRASKGAGK
jgi:hypothetical protein